MTNQCSRTIADVFNLLHSWRHLPGYPLESRAAPFFALFLRDVLSDRFGMALHPVVVPEFPLRIGSLYDENELRNKYKNSNPPSPDQSYNVDYLVLSEDRTTVFLVELKTDLRSWRKEQHDYLMRAQERGLRTLVCGVLEIPPGSSLKQKYVHLLHLLSQLEFVSIPNRERLFEKTFPKGKPGWTTEFDKVGTRLEREPKIKIVYVQPKVNADHLNGEVEYICFKEFADTIQKHGDLGCIFANFLRQWTAEAGSCCPTA